MNQKFKVGVLVADKALPELTGVIIRIDENDPEPYKILVEGKVLACDIDYLYRYCKVVSGG